MTRPSEACQFPTGPTDFGFRHLQRRRLRWRIRNPTFPFAGMRLKKDASLARTGSAPETPPLRWKISGPDLTAEKRSRPRGTDAGDLPVSARKLAFVLWHLLVPEASRRCYRVPSRWDSTHVVGHRGHPYLCYPFVTEYDPKAVNRLCCSLVPQLKSSTSCKQFEPSVMLSISAMEKVTKWDAGFSSIPGNVLQFYDNLKLLKNPELIKFLVICALQAALKQSQIRIDELESERKLSKKKLERFLRKLAVERTSWKSREHERIHGLVNRVMDELNRERKNHQRMEIANFKLFSELAEAKQSAKQFLQDYKKERKTRELIEEVCDELTKKVRECKAEVEDLRNEMIKICEEVEEEKRMLQMAEVWREERVQMKLIDAKLTLEEKYSQLRKLVADLDAFLKSNSVISDSVANREAELLREAACSIKIDDIKFSYQPPTSEDIFSAFEDIQSDEEKRRKVDSSYNYSTTSRLDMHTLNSDLYGLRKNLVQRHTDRVSDRDRDTENDSVIKTVSNSEQPGFHYPSEGSDPSMNRLCEESDVSGSGTDWDENTDDFLNIEITEDCAAPGSYSRTKESSICSLQSPNRNAGLVNSSIEPFTGIVSQEVSGKGGLCLPTSGHWSSGNSGNLQLTQWTEGFLGGIKKSSLMAKLLEERLEDQKAQLHHVVETEHSEKLIF